MSNIKGDLYVKIQPADTKRIVTIFCTICSSTTLNDGYIPYGTTVSGVTHKVYDRDRTEDVTSDITFSTPTVGDPEIVNGKNGQRITIELKYPTTYGDGDYNLEYIFNLSDGGTIECNYDRIRAEQL